MKIYRAGLATVLMLSLAGCLGNNVLIEYVPVVPTVGAELRTPVTLPERDVEGLASVGIILADHVEGLETANGRIVAIDCILTAAENSVQPECEK